jgi:mannitol-1-phosphate 5-dehydrogenase
MGKKAVHFGAGNIGRGFVAELYVSSPKNFPFPLCSWWSVSIYSCSHSLHKSGYEVVFADVQDDIINQLQSKKSYKVIQVGTEGNQESEITNYRAINSRRYESDVITEISTADIVTCSVGPGILRFIAPVIAKGIDARDTNATPLAVIACENAIGATDILAEYIKHEDNTPRHRLDDHHERARFANSAIDRIVPAQEEDAGLDVKLERFYEWVVDRTPFKDHDAPSIDGIKWVDDLIPYIERKLYTVNTGHGAAAYFGYYYNKATVYDALQDDRVLAEVRAALRETSALIVNKHGIHVDEQKEYVEQIIKRISNPHLEDAVERVGRAPLRKLGRKERFIGPASELAEQGKDCTALLGAAEMAFRFQNVEEDEESGELARIMKQKSARDVVSHVCNLEDSHPLFERVVKIVEKVQRESKSKI